MKRAKDFREIAWNALRGHYWWTVLAALIAIVLGGHSGQSPFNFSFGDTDFSQLSQKAQEAFQGTLDPEMVTTLVRPFVGIVTALIGLAFVFSIALFIVGSAVELGYNRFNIALYENVGAMKIEQLFSCFSYFGRALLLRFLMALKILLWTLLLIVPGIIAAYRYAMAPYLLAEHPEMTASEAIEQSKVMMAGNKGRLFCLQFSFIGWYLLAALTAGVGSIFLAPYTKAAETAFYLDLTGRLPQPAAAYTAPSAAPSAAPGEGESSGKEFI